jgi:hypothetical protein
MQTLLSILSGAVAMSSLVAAIFFLRFWNSTRDRFFLIFAVAFALYAISQFALGWPRASEFETYFYLPRLVTFALIVAAVLDKNRAGVR